MDILRNILLVLHFVGLAAILGGVLAQTKAFRTGAKIVSPILHGAYLQLLTGLLLVGLIEMGDGELNNAKIGVKLVILVAITVIAFINRKKAAVATWVVPVIGLLTLANIVIAVVWK